MCVLASFLSFTAVFDIEITASTALVVILDTLACYGLHAVDYTNHRISTDTSANMRLSLLSLLAISSLASEDEFLNPRWVGAKTPYSAADPAYNTSIKHFACGTSGDTQATTSFINAINTLSQRESSTFSPQGSLGALNPLNYLRKRGYLRINVPLYMHIVTTAAKANTIPQTMVNAQVQAMNQVYNHFNIYFTLTGTTFTSNDAWAIGATSADDTNMKVALRKGKYSSLNLYLQTDLVGGILGKCSLPTNVGTNPAPNVYVTDGCNIAAGSMPGGPIGGYNLGMTAVHETGHWLGLLHTFEGYSCTGPGDYVSDTAVEAQSTNGCPTAPWKNTCGRPKGFFLSRKGDPIRNYMDYSVDACYAGFTKGQITRINNLWKLYRLNK